MTCYTPLPFELAVSTNSLVMVTEIKLRNFPGLSRETGQISRAELWSGLGNPPEICGTELGTLIDSRHDM